ncbi:hypothetical protein LB559_00430 [Mesorhizobium sp. BR1-1-3]|uniref:helix-turn-helix domain-containing protein n=1 Tax=Mesorhizobium sp. BR1-1-3 TaxID=2876651 RepID=UPI001CD12F16|nr:hypothetical protein [Mesorhizobium sp. BR1-1-3]MBZ9886411.1 hypothetical protein [Mesorhizobium sp. BR1-1-3]
MKLVQHGGKTVARVVDKFEAKDLGAPFKVVLNDSVKVTYDEATGEVVSYMIPDLDGLLWSVVMTRLLHPRKLFGADIKFVRKVLGLKQKELASKIDLSVEHLSRCETNVLPMSPGSEKLFRIFALKSAFKLHNMKACDAKTKLEDGLDRLFDGVKPMSVFDVKDELELNFYRSKMHRKSPGSDGADDGHWDAGLEAA